MYRNINIKSKYMLHDSSRVKQCLVYIIITKFLYVCVSVRDQKVSPNSILIPGIERASFVYKRDRVRFEFGPQMAEI